MAGFARVAILVATASGKLQIQRHAVQDGARNVGVFMDEKSATAHLTEPPRVRPRI